MARPTEQRVNKSFVVTGVDRPLIDPGATDASDESYDRIEELRLERGVADGTKGVEAQSTGEDATVTQASGDDVEAAREARFDDLERLHEGRVDDAPALHDATTDPGDTAGGTQVDIIDQPPDN